MERQPQVSKLIKVACQCSTAGYLSELRFIGSQDYKIHCPKKSDATGNFNADYKKQAKCQNIKNLTPGARESNAFGLPDIRAHEDGFAKFATFQRGRPQFINCRGARVSTSFGLCLT